ncbi:hypothetical protein [Candidatus Enterovibrio escicola]|uniref:Mobile element protein n=1 Tax=Candidatus Enterovibrio escicola TaxID=1927127 RepID=A0A2A5T4R1_9GAMM|nr:hypothetical protein [Candidatus Enterovibrio escacola]PCS23108.1 Mobile element protein [Candidatus Enterovibrio escacola]
MFNPSRRKIQQVSADEAYDTKAYHPVLKNQEISPSIPPRSNVWYGRNGILEIEL